MKTITRRFSIALCAAVFGLGLMVNPSFAQNSSAVSKIIKQHIESFGGRAKLEAVKTVKTSALMTIAGPGGDIEAEIESLQSGAKFLMVLDIPSIGEIRQGSDGNRYWMINPGQGASLMDGDESAAVATQFSQPFPCLGWEKYDGEIKIDGSEKVDDIECHKLVFKPKSGHPIIRYFGKKTGRLHMMKMTQPSPQGNMDVTVYPSDYKESGGITIPFKQVSEMPFGEMTMEIDEVKYNAKIKDSKFQLPKDIQNLVDGK